MAKLIYLDDYLAQPDFKTALRTLATDFRQTLGLPQDLDELGLVCANVVEAADYLQSTVPGMGTFMLAEGSPVKFSDGGEPVPYRTRVGFAYYDGVLLELAEAGTGSDIFSSHLAPDGRITIHHMGYFARGDEHRIGATNFAPRLKEQGYRAPEWAAEVFAGMTIKVAIYDTYDAADNLSLEFLDFRLLGLPVDYPVKGSEAFAELQVKFGPRVLYVPGPMHEGMKLLWSAHGSIVLAATPEEVWAAITEAPSLTKWMNAEVTVVKPGLGGPGGQGEKRRIQGEISGHAVDALQTITESKPGLLLRYQAADTGVFHDAEGVQTITRDEGGTELVWQLSFVPEHTFEGLRLVHTADAWLEACLDRLAEQLDPAAKGSSTRSLKSSIRGS